MVQHASAAEFEGYADVVLSGHHTTAKEPPSSVSAHQAQRYNVEPVSVRPWCCSYKKRSAEGEDNAPSYQTALAWAHDLTNVPNEVVKIIWMVDMVPDPSPAVRFVRPCLCWSQTMDLEEGQIFQWA